MCQRGNAAATHSAREGPALFTQIRIASSRIAGRATIATASALLLAPAFVAAAAVPNTAPTPGKTSTTQNTAARPSSVFAVRASSHPSAVRDASGKLWERMPLTFGTTQRSRVTVTSVPSPRERIAYQSLANNATGYQLPVPNGTYRVRLMFVEPSAAPGERVFDITAENRKVANRFDIARVAGRNRGYDLNITTRVTDGLLNIKFTSRSAKKPVISAVTVTSRGKVATPSNTRVVKLNARSPFYTPIDKAPLAANSEQSIAHLASQVRDNWGGTAATNAYEFNGAVNIATPKTPRIRVGFHNCQKKPSTPAGLYDGPKYFVNVPVPANATAARGSDGEMSIYSPATDQLWEFWQMRRGTSGWEACWGGRIDKVSSNIGQFAFPYGVSASGLAMAPGLIGIDEARRGTINHAMYLAVLDSHRWDKFSWPANRSDGISTNPNVLMEGQRIRLDPTINLNDYNLTPFGRMVAEAAQKYGFIISDRSGAVAVATQDGRAEQARTGINPWGTLLGGPAYSALKNFPWDKMQALPKDYGKN